MRRDNPAAYENLLQDMADDHSQSNRFLAPTLEDVSIIWDILGGGNKEGLSKEDICNFVKKQLIDLEGDLQA